MSGECIEDKSDACAEATIWAISEFMEPEHELYLAILRNKMRSTNDFIECNNCIM